MEWLQAALDFIVKSLLQEFVVVVFGVLSALFIQNRWEKWRYGSWEVRILKEGKDILHRGISPGKVKEILAEPAELSVFLKGVASPYAWINCDLLEDGKKLGLLHEDLQKRHFILDLDKNPVKQGANKVGESPVSDVIESAPSAKQPITLINFSHPLTDTQLELVAKKTGQAIGDIRMVKTQIDHEQPFAGQIKALLDQVDLTSDEWQSKPILVNPPALHSIAVALLAELHGRMGYFPAVIRLKPIPDTVPVQFEFAEIINLQHVRDTARQSR